MMLDVAESHASAVPPAGWLATLTLLAVMGCASPSHPSAGGVADDAPAVVAVPPSEVAVREVELPGSFEPYERALLYAKVTGYVSKLEVDIGDRVRSGAPLLRLDIPEMESTIERARADVDSARTALQKAEAEVRRSRITHERLSGLQKTEPLAVMEQDVDMAEADLQVAEATVRTTQAEISVAEARLQELMTLMGYAVLRAPFPGVITRRLVDTGALVVSGDDGGEPVLEIVREDRLRLVLAIPEPVVPETRPGLAAEIHLDSLPDCTFQGTISRVAGALTQDTRTMRAEIDMDSHDGRLRPGMYATVRLLLEGSESGGLGVPASAVRRDGDGQAWLWTVAGGVAARTNVTVAREDGITAVIRAGLRPDVLVVTDAPATLRDGEEVRVVASTGIAR